MRSRTVGPRGPRGVADRRRLIALFSYVLLFVLLIPFVFPSWWMVTSSLKPIHEVFAFPPQLLPTTFEWENYQRAFDLQPLARQYFNSMYIAVLVTAGTLLVSSLAGYAFARIRFPGQNLLFLLLLSALLLPSEVTIIPLFQLMRVVDLIDTHVPLIVVPIFGAQSVFGVFMMRQFFLGLPTELEDAGRVDGLGRLGLYWRIALPLAKPALAALAVLSFLHSWNLFLEPLVYLSSKDLFTLPLALSQYTDAYGGPIWNVQLAATTLSVVPVLGVFVLAQRHFIAGIAHAGLKG